MQLDLAGNGLKCYHLNVRSLFSKVDQLKNMSCFLTKNVSVFGLTETHLTSNMSDGELCIPHYNLFRRDRVSGPGGGVALYVLNSIKCVFRNDIQSPETESLWLEILQPHTSSLLVCIIYRPQCMRIEWYDLLRLN